MIQKKHKKILLLWYMEDENFGDVLIFLTVREHLIKAGFNVESHEVGDNVEKILNHANQCDFLLFAGGGIIERYIPNVIQNFQKYFKSLKVPYGVMGFGIGDFDYSQYYQQIAFWVNNAQFFYVRDSITKEKLDCISQTDRVIFSADCVFANDEIRKIQSHFGNMHGINMRGLPYQDITGDFDWTQVNETLKKCNCNLLIMDSSNEWEKITINLENRLDLHNKLTLDRDERIKVIMDDIEKCEWIIAMRFHVVLVAAMLGVATVPIMYCPKVRYLSEQLGLEDLAVEITEIDKLPEKIKLLQENRQVYFETINRNVIKLEKKADEMFQEVVDFLVK